MTTAPDKAPAQAQVTHEVARKHGALPAWALLGIGIDAAGKLRAYWPWWTEIDGKRFLTRFIVFRSPFAACSITRIHMADNQREYPHDHSHTFWSLKLGWYSEKIYDDPADLLAVRHVRHRPFSIHRLRWTQAHSITEVSPRLWTVLLSGPTRQTSSYWTPAGKQPTGVNGDQDPDGPGQEVWA
jgi:hypothetical protein